ncbi:MAG TPA: MgtC/SapB family protein [Caulobacteraceae bacterium]|jgi:putative Mg2+ transporter-C (MgtC) family protein
MPLLLSYQDMALRLALTVIACAAIGYDRGARGHAAGLRTVILVGLAAAIAMIQMNLLLPVGGKTPSSFGVMDMMRMPLGVLTGVGFIGGGAILKRGDIVTGVTTAATLWLTTMVGLAIGGGQIVLGVAGTLIAMVVLFPLKRLEHEMRRDHRARVTVRTASDAPPTALPQALAPLGCKAQLVGQAEEDGRAARRLRYELSWRQKESSGAPLDLLATMNAGFDVVAFEMTSETPD